MTSVTHREFAMVFVYLGVIALYRSGVSQVNYYLAMLIMIWAGRKGALFPDVDHEWQNVKEKTTSNWVINHIIHLIRGKHRSWCTHSIDVAAVFCLVSYLGPKIALANGRISVVNYEVLSILLFGFTLGWLSHLFSDMLTSAGVRVLCFVNYKVALVPRRLLGITFNTGHAWEQFVYKVMKVSNIPFGILTAIYPLYFEGYLDKYLM